MTQTYDPTVVSAAIAFIYAPQGKSADAATSDLFHRAVNDIPPGIARDVLDEERRVLAQMAGTHTGPLSAITLRDLASAYPNPAHVVYAAHTFALAIKIAAPEINLKFDVPPYARADARGQLKYYPALVGLI